MASPESLAPSVEAAPPWAERSSSLASVSIFLADEVGRLLMVQDIDEHGGKWAPVAGYIDDLTGEEPEVAALREAKEELGLDIRLEKLLGVWHYYEKNGFQKEDGKPEKHKMHVGYAYTGTILSGTFAMQKEEIQNWGFFTPDEVDQVYRDGKLKTPEYNYVGFELWKKKSEHPLEVVVSNGRTKVPSLTFIDADGPRSPEFQNGNR